MISGDELEKLIPQQGAMCLLDAIVRWDDDSIVCHTARHRAADNPLRTNGSLSVMHAIELAAQAMAAHQRLCGVAGNERRTGLLVSVRQCTFARERLDDCDTPLVVESVRIAATADALMYRFSVGTARERVAEGRASVALVEDAR